MTKSINNEIDSLAKCSLSYSKLFMRTCDVLTHSPIPVKDKKDIIKEIGRAHVRAERLIVKTIFKHIQIEHIKEDTILARYIYAHMINGNPIDFI